MAALINSSSDVWSFRPCTYMNLIPKSFDPIESEFIDCLENNDTTRADTLLHFHHQILKNTLIEITSQIASEVFPYSQTVHESSSVSKLGYRSIRFLQANILHISVLKCSPDMTSVITRYLPELAINSCAYAPSNGDLISFSALQLAIYNQHSTALKIFKSLLPHDFTLLQNIVKTDFRSSHTITHPSQLHLMHALAETCDLEKTEALFEHLSAVGRQPSVLTPLGSTIKSYLIHPSPSSNLPEMPAVIADLIVGYTTFNVNEIIINAVNHFVPTWRQLGSNEINTVRVSYLPTSISRRELPSTHSGAALSPSILSSPKITLVRSNAYITSETIDSSKMIMVLRSAGSPELPYRVAPAHTVITSDKSEDKKLQMLKLLSSAGANFGCIQIFHPAPFLVPSLSYSQGLENMAPDLFKPLNELGPQTLKFDLSLPTTFKNMVVKFDVLLADRIQHAAQQMIETTAKKISEMLDD